MTLVELTGFSAAGLTAACWFPQAIRTIRTRDTRGISLVAQGMFAIGVSLWAIYGFMIKSWPVILCNLITLVPVLIIFTLKIRLPSDQGRD